MHCVSTGFMLICRDNACLFSAFVFRWTPPQRWSPTFNKKPSQVQLGKEFKFKKCCYSTYPVRDKIFVTMLSLVSFYSVGIKYISAFFIYNPYGISTVKGYFCYKYIIPTE